MKKYLFVGALLTLVGLYPINAISRELDARTTLILHLTVARCLFLEGIMTKEEAVKGAFKSLEEDEGISIKKLTVLMKDEDIEKEITRYVKEYGGCAKMEKIYREKNNPR